MSGLVARYRFGLPLSDVESPQCPGCSETMDKFGDHALCCAKLDIYARHNTVRNEIASICADMQLRAPTSGCRPADILLHGLEDSSPVAVDVSVVHPLQPSSSLARVQSRMLAKPSEQLKPVAGRAVFCQRSLAG